MYNRLEVIITPTGRHGLALDGSELPHGALIPTTTHGDTQSYSFDISVSVLPLVAAH